MSWLEKIQDNLVIQTGDTKIYKPTWINASKSIEYHVSEFDFIGVSGTFVSRKLPRGTQIPLEIYFQGEDHLTVTDNFIKSAANPKPWTLNHPFYEKILAQPLSISVDNSKYNVSKIKISLFETIGKPLENAEIDIPGQVDQNKINADILAVDSYTNNVKPTSVEIIELTDVVDTLDKNYSKIVIYDADENYFRALLGNTRNYILSATAYPLRAMRSVQEVINFPLRLTNDVFLRVKTLQEMFYSLHETLFTLSMPSNILETAARSTRVLYEFLCGGVVSSLSFMLCQGGYRDRTQLLDAYNIVNDTYQYYLAFLDSLTSTRADIRGSYFPDINFLQGIDFCVNYSLANLFIISLNAKQERIIYLENDSNIINLTHRFYGPNNFEENIEKFINENDIGLNEMFEIKKDRRLVYYV